MVNNLDIRRVFVLGLDCLEYDLVEEMNLKTLKQKEYGKVKVPISGRCPVTSVVWASFLTGKKPEDHGIKTLKVCNNRIAQFLNEITTVKFSNQRKKLKPKTTVHLPWERKNIGKTLTFLRKYQELLRDLMNKIETPHYPTRQDLKCNTILDKILNSKEYNFPYYSANLEKETKFMGDYLNGKISLDEFITIEMNKLKGDFKKIEEQLKSEWKVFLSYTYPIDAVSHMLFLRRPMLKKIYLEVSKLVKNLLNKVDKNTLIFIISDHGIDFKTGYHSNHGFYSCNKKLGLYEPSIVDFKKIIEGIIQ